MSFAQPFKAFDPKDVAKRLSKSRVRDHAGWGNHLSCLSEDQRYYVQKEFLQKYPPAQFEQWFGLPAMFFQLSADPLLASLHNPTVWLYALEKSADNAFASCRVLYAYWSSIALLRPSERFETKLLKQIHDAVGKAVAYVERDGQPWTTGLTPAVVSYPEETAMFDLPWPKALDAITAYILQYRDLGCLQRMPIAYPTLTIVIKLMESGVFPERHEKNALPWPTPEDNAPWSDDLVLAGRAVDAHPHLRHWWTFPTVAPTLPEHLQDAALMLDIGVQLGYLDTIKEWISRP